MYVVRTLPELQIEVTRNVGDRHAAGEIAEISAAFSGAFKINNNPNFSMSCKCILPHQFTAFLMLNNSI